MFPLDPRNWLVSEQVQPFIMTRSRDLAATDGSLKKASEGKYIIFNETPPKGQVMVVKVVTPWAMYRDNLGVGTENVSFCDPAAVNGQVLFEPLVGGKSPMLFDVDVPAFKVVANASNKDTTGGKGIPFISADPWADTQRAWSNPMFTFVVRGGTQLIITFSILRPAANNPIPVVYTIPPVAGVGRRIDFAGVTIAGLAMNEQLYEQLSSSMGAHPGV